MKSFMITRATVVYSKLLLALSKSDFPTFVHFYLGLALDHATHFSGIILLALDPS